MDDYLINITNTSDLENIIKCETLREVITCLDKIITRQDEKIKELESEVFSIRSITCPRK